MKSKLLPLLFLLAFSAATLQAQTPDLTPWTDNPYGNEWIDYSKKYVRVGIVKDGMYRIPLATLRESNRLGSDANSANIQVWHRGQEVAILTTNDDIFFYGLKNDGASDGLMFRPNPNERLNSYISFFSEEGSYFFTTCDDCNPARIESISATPAQSVTFQTTHWNKLIKTYAAYETSGANANARFNPPFAFTTFFGAQTELIQSYYTRASTFTSPMIYSNTVPSIGPLLNTQSIPGHLEEPFQLTNWDSNSPVEPNLEFSLHAHHRGSRRVDVRVGPNTSSLENSSNTVYSEILDGNSGEKSGIISLTPNVNFSSTGEGYIQFRKPSIPSTSDWYGVGYYKIEYPQTTRFEGPSHLFEFRSTNQTLHVELTNVPSEYRVLDISDRYNIKEVFNGTFNAGVLRLSILRDQPETPVQLLVYNTSSGVETVPSSTIYAVDFEALAESTTSSQKKTSQGAWNPSAYDYLIITNDRLGKPVSPTSAAIEYSNYRSSSDGGSHRVLTVDIRNIYNQFNYGEPSALAIRRFVNFMLQDGVRTGRHQVFLIGNSVTLPNRVRRELPDEVPTFGDAGSDILLVSGMNGVSQDLPTIPIGRLSAFTQTEVRNYLNKVREYENQTAVGSSQDLAWRKNVVHVVGGRYDHEPSQFSGYFLNGRNGYQSPNSMVVSLDPERSVTLLTNEHVAPVNGVRPVTPASDLVPLVNAGVGMIAYYGHGSQTATTYNIGNVSAGSFGYSESRKYPFVYFNGCGVGNVFTSHTGHPISSNWLITANKGSVAIFGNSYLSYVTPTASYLPVLYKHLYLRPDSQRKTIGQVHLDVSSEFLDGRSSDAFAFSNVHQTNLYGDPALRVLISTPSSALPVELLQFTATLKEKSVHLNWHTASEINNSHFIVERSYNGVRFEIVGRVNGSASRELVTGNRYNFLDSDPLPGISYYRLRQYDLDGKNSTSNIVSISNQFEEAIILYPNPSKSDAVLQLNIPTSVSEWILRDLGGKVLKRGKTPQVSISELSGGNYFIEINTVDGDTFSRTIVKQ